MTIEGSFFETEEASQLNKEGIDFSKNGKIEKGLNKFFLALEIEPENPTIVSNIGVNYMNVSDFKNAEIFFKKALVVSDSTYSAAGVNLGILYYDTKEFDKGIKILDHVILNETEKSIVFSAIINRALIFIANGDCWNALKDFNYIKMNCENMDDSDYNINNIQKKLNKFCNTY